MILHGEFKITKIIQGQSQKGKNYRVIKALDADGDVTDMYCDDKLRLPSDISLAKNYGIHLNISTGQGGKVYITAIDVTEIKK